MSGPVELLGEAMGMLSAVDQAAGRLLNPLANLLPGFPALRVGDMAIGLPHAHMHPPNLIPPNPVPIPLPSAGPVIPIPIMSGSTTTYIGGQPAARCGDMGAGIWCGGFFPMYETFLGSSNVFVDGERACRVGVDITKHCIFTSPRPQDPPLGPFVGTTVSGCFNVLIGGVPMPSLTQMAIGGLFKGLFKGLKKLGGASMKVIRRAAKDMKPGFIKCTILKAEPVDIVRGEVVLEQLDGMLPGRLAIPWVRRYTSHNFRVGACGRGWETPADARLIFHDDGSASFHDGGAGASVFAQLPAEGADLRSVADGAVLTKTQGHWAVRTRDGRSWTFAARARDEALVAAITDRCGNMVRFVRFAGELREIHTEAGTVAVQAAHGRLHALTLPGADGPLIRYDYDGDNLAAALDPLGAPRSYAYDPAGRMLRHTDRNGLSFHYAHDDAGRCVHAWGDGGLYDYHFAYGEDVDDHLEPGGRTRITDSLGHTSTVVYDDCARVLREVDPLGGVTRYTYDEVGRCNGVIDPAGRRTDYAYDDHGNLLCETRPDGTSVRRRFDAEDREIEVVSPRGDVWRQDWDERGLLRAIASPLGAEQRYAYNHRGDLCAHTDPLGHTTEVQRDAAGRVRMVIDAEGRRTRYERDAAGELVARIDPDGATTRFEYDRKARLVAVVRPGGARIEIAHDAEDRVTQVRDELGHRTRLEYFGIDSLAARHQPDGTTVRYAYDPEERLLAVTNERGQTYRLERDPLGRISTVVDYWGQARRCERDGSGLVVRTIDPLGQEVVFTRDRIGRVTRRHADDVIERFTYDPDGRLVGTDAPDARVRRTHDADGRLVSEQQGDFKIHYTHDAASRVIARESGAGNVGRYAHDRTGLLTRVTINDADPIEIRRDAAGQIVEEMLAPGLARRTAHDTDGRVTGVDLQTSDRPVLSTRYDYDARGDLVRRTDDAGEDRFVYDPMRRIRQHLDPEGRLRTAIPDPAGDLLRTIEAAGEGPDWRRRATLPGLECSFDAAGQLRRRAAASSGELALDWDALGRLRSTTPVDADTTRYTYDAEGRRTRKSTGARTTRFFWDGDALLADGVDGARPREFVYYPGTFEPLAQIAADGNIYFSQNDPNGLPRALVDRTGRVVWSARYSAHGELTAFDIAEVDNPLRLQGQYADPETGLHYNRFRYYDPHTASFISQDPLGIVAGEALYSLAPSVWAWIDPQGLTCKLARYDGPKPKYTVNEAHVPGPKFNPKKEVLPADAAEVYKKAVPDASEGAKHWYGKNSDGIIYRFMNSNDGTAHFSGSTAAKDGIRTITQYALKRLENL